MGLFAVAPDGTITLARDLLLGGYNTQSLVVSVSDGRVWVAPTISVTVNLKPLVVITGDLQGTEAPVGELRDEIRLEFYRIAQDVSKELTVSYRVTWVSAGERDLEDSTTLVPANETTGQITFAAGRSRFNLYLYAFQDNRKEGLEQFTVEIIQDPSSYCALGQASAKFPSIRNGATVNRTATVSIMDATTLFARQNSDPDLADARLDGIDINDIAQGPFDNCGFMAAIGSEALHNPADIPARMRPQLDGTVAVDFYNWRGVRQTVFVDMTLDDGDWQSKLSKDTSETATVRSFEIWPQIYEKAYYKWAYGGTPTPAEHPNAILRCLNGRVASNTFTWWETAASLERVVRDAYAADKKVLFATNFGEGQRIPGTNLVPNHAYVLREIDGDTAVLYNPWGYNHARIALADLKQYFRCYYIQASAD